MGRCRSYIPDLAPGFGEPSNKGLGAAGAASPVLCAQELLSWGHRKDSALMAFLSIEVLGTLIDLDPEGGFGSGLVLSVVHLAFTLVLSCCSPALLCQIP